MSSLRSSISKRARALAGATAVSLGGFAVAGFGGFRPASTYAAGITPRAISGPCSLESGTYTSVADDTQLQAAVLASTDDSVICVAPSADDTITLSAPLVLDDTALTLVGADDTHVVLQAPASKRHINAIFDGLGGDDTLSLMNLEFYGGRSFDDTGGGALRVLGGDALVLKYVDFRNNEADPTTTATGAGGAIYVAGAYSTIDITGGTFDHNSASHYGGAIYTPRDDTITLIATNTTFQDDTAVWGGAIFVRGAGSTIDITDSTFDHNYGSSGAGALYATSRSTVTLDNTEFTYNIAQSAYAGAIYVGGASATIDITGGTFDHNSADDSGGAIWAYGGAGASLTTDGTNFHDDTATNAGGAIYVKDAATTVTLNGGTFDHNSAARGGAIYSRGNVIVSGATLASNSADYGGGVFGTGNVTARYTTFRDNSAMYSGGAILSEQVARAINSTFYENRTHAGGVAGILAGLRLGLYFVTSVDDSSADGSIFHEVGIFSPTIVGSVISPAVGGGSACQGAADDSSLDSFVTDSSCGSGDDTINTNYSSRSALGLSGSITIDDSVLVPSVGSPLIAAAPFDLITGVTLDQLGVTRGPVTTTVGAVQVTAAPPTPPPTPTYPPTAPLGPAAVAGDRSAVVTWIAPASTGSFPITTYQVTNDIDATTCLLTVTEGTPLACTLTKLANGTPYRFRVRALNGDSWGPWSDWTTPVTPEPPPVTKTIVITGTRGEVRGKPGVIVTGLTSGLDNQHVTPWFKFPGQTTYTEGNARPTINDDGTFTWQRKTSKKIRIYITADETRSNTITITKR